MFIIAIILAIVIAKLRGGDLKNLAYVNFHKFSISLVILLIIDIILRLLRSNSSSDLSLLIFRIYPYFNLIMYLIIIIVLELNKHLKFFRIIEAGFILNYLPMVLNGGKMPVSGAALKKLGLEESMLAMENGLNMTHSLIREDSNFKILSDIIPITIPYKSVISIGDIIILLGFVCFVVYYSKDRGGELI